MPESLAPLSQSAIEMGVAAVDEYVLAGYVRRLRRDKKQNHRGDFMGLRHSLAEGYLRNDVREFFFGIGKCADPLLVERRDYFGGDQGVHANSAGKQFGGPVSSQRKYRAFCRSVSGGAALPRDGHFRGN